MIIIQNVLETKSLMSYDVLMLALFNKKAAKRMLTIKNSRNNLLIERRSYLINIYNPRIYFLSMQTSRDGRSQTIYEKNAGNSGHVGIHRKEYYKQLKEHLIHYV
jgi:hypothetical protein